jgi:hypothetical protein
MAKDHRKVSAQITQGILFEDPDFLREIVERVLQEMLEAEITELATATATNQGR